MEKWEHADPALPSRMEHWRARYVAIRLSFRPVSPSSLSCRGQGEVGEREKGSSPLCHAHINPIEKNKKEWEKKIGSWKKGSGRPTYRTPQGHVF